MKMYTPKGVEVLVHVDQVPLLKEAGWTRTKPVKEEIAEEDSVEETVEVEAEPEEAPAPKKVKAAAPKKKVAIKKG